MDFWRGRAGLAILIDDLQCTFRAKRVEAHVIAWSNQRPDPAKQPRQGTVFEFALEHTRLHGFAEAAQHRMHLRPAPIVRDVIGDHHQHERHPHTGGQRSFPPPGTTRLSETGTLPEHTAALTMRVAPLPDAEISVRLSE